MLDVWLSILSSILQKPRQDLDIYKKTTGKKVSLSNFFLAHISKVSASKLRISFLFYLIFECKYESYFIQHGTLIVHLFIFVTYLLRVYNFVCCLQLSLKVVDQMLKLGWEGDGLSPLIK